MTATTERPADGVRSDAPPQTAPTQPAKHMDPAFQAYMLLRAAFITAPILFGIDKFFNWMTYWPKYLWIGFPHFLGVSPQAFMYGVGVIEIAAGLGVLLLPRLAPYVVAAWLAGIITNLVIIGIAGNGHIKYWDVALRDFGLLLAALALARLAAAFAPQRLFHSHR